MGNPNAERIQYIPREVITSALNDDRQTMAFTGYLKQNDVVDIHDIDASGNILSTLASGLTISAIDEDIAVVLSATVDTSAPTGTYVLEVRQIDDAHEALERLFRRTFKGSATSFNLRQAIVGQKLNSPSGGKGTYQVADVAFWRDGDTVDLLGDEGVIASAATIESISPRADDSNNLSQIVLTTTPDTSAFTNPIIINRTINMQEAVYRVQEDVDQIDKPVGNEDMGTLNGAADKNLVAFETANLFMEASSDMFLDGNKKKLGPAGTRAFLAVGTYPANSDALKVTSMILDDDGDKSDLILTDPAGSSSALAVTVSGSFNTGYTVDVSLETDGGSALISTAAEVAAAINAHATAKRIMQAQYGGDGSGVMAAAGSANLAGSVDGSGDYSEVEQVYENSIANTGFKWICFHIFPSLPNRPNNPPSQSEDLVVGYKRPLENIDR